MFLLIEPSIEFIDTTPDLCVSDELSSTETVITQSPFPFLSDRLIHDSEELAVHSTLLETHTDLLSLCGLKDKEVGSEVR